MPNQWKPGHKAASHEVLALFLKLMTGKITLHFISEDFHETKKNLDIQNLRL